MHTVTICAASGIESSSTNNEHSLHPNSVLMRKRIVQAASNQLENTSIIFQQFPFLNKEQMLFQFISNCKRKQKNTNTNNGLHFINILFKHDDIASACIPWTRSHYSSVVKHRGTKNVQYTPLSESKFNIHNEWYHWKDDLRIFGQQGTTLFWHMAFGPKIITMVITICHKLINYIPLQFKTKVDAGYFFSPPPFKILQKHKQTSEMGREQNSDLQKLPKWLKLL